MKYYKVTMVIERTEEYYIAAENEEDAFDACSNIEPIINNDDCCVDDTVIEITKDEYESN
jgi:hypothetical protein